MKPFKNYILIAILLLFIASCSRLNPFADKELIARVGEAKLYKNDVESLFNPETTPQDSIKLLESYVNMWVRKQLKIQEAERFFRKSSDDIERMVEEYRSSLLSQRLDQYYVEQRLDTLFSDSSIVVYYNTYKEDFRLDRPIIKGRVVKLPAEDKRNYAKLKEFIGSSNEDRVLDFRDISYKNEYEITEFTSWTDFDDFLAALPVGRHTDNADLLLKRDVIELRDEDSVYLVYITERLLSGDINPMERVEGVIRRVLFNQQKQDVIRQYEDSLYNVAKGKRMVEVNVKTGIAE